VGHWLSQAYLGLGVKQEALTANELVRWALIGLPADFWRAFLLHPRMGFFKYRSASSCVHASQGGSDGAPGQNYFPGLNFTELATTVRIKLLSVFSQILSDVQNVLKRHFAKILASTVWSEWSKLCCYISCNYVLFILFIEVYFVVLTGCHQNR